MALILTHRRTRSGLLAVLVLVACGKTPEPGKVLASNVNGSISTSFLVTGLNPPAAAAGDTLSVEGVGLTSDLQVQIGSLAVPAFGLKDDRSVSVTVPKGAVGMTVVQVRQGADSVALPFILLDGDKKLPLMAGVQPEALCKGQKFYSLAGQLLEGTRDCAAGTSSAACTTEGQTNCLATADHPAVEVATLATRVAAGQAVAGVAGTVVPPACQKDGDIGCTSTVSLPAAVAAGLAAKVVAGNTVAGILGTYTADLPDPAMVRASATVGGVTGRLVDCAVDGAAGCVVGTGGGYRAAAVANFAAPDVRVGVTVAGVAGTLVGAPAACASDGAIGCLANAGFKATDATKLLAGVLKKGVTVGGIAGDYPSSTNPLAGATGTPGLPGLGAATAAGAYEWFLSDGSRLSGSVTDPGVIAPGAAAQTFNASVYRGFTVAGDANLVAGKILSGTTIFGVSGTVTAKPADCSADGAVGCVATSAFKAADMGLAVAGSIRSGVTVAGTVGGYPSVGHKLTGSGANPDLESLTGATPAGTYQWFAADGTPYTGSIASLGTVTPTAAVQPFNGVYNAFTVAGDASLIPANIVAGASIYNVHGVANGAACTGSTSPLCAGGGSTDCYATGSYVSCTTASLDAGNIRSGVAIGGVTGDFPSTTYPLSGASATADLLGTTFDAQVASSSQLEWWDSQGVRQTGAGAGNLSSGNILSGQTILGVVGTVVPKPANCAADGGTGCVAVAGYPAASTAGAADKILSGQTIAGVAGDVTLPVVGKVLTGTTFGVAGAGSTGTLTSPAAGNVLAAAGTFGIGGTGTTPTLTLPTAANVRVGNGAFGAGGNGTTPTLPDCAADGAAGCVVVGPNYAAAATTGGLAGDILSGVTVGGMSGSLTLPAVSKVLTGTTFGVAATGSTGSLTVPTAGSVLSTFGSFGIGGTAITPTLTLPPAADVYTGQQFGVAGTGSTGTLTLAAAGNVRLGNGAFGIGATSVTPTLVDCSADGALGCVTVTGYAAAKLANFAAGNILAGTTIAGVAGSLANCAADGATGCQAVTAFKAADMALAVVGNIKSGATIAGVAGNYGPACSSDGQQGCLASGVFKAGNVTGISTWDLRVGQTLAGIAGALKTNCRNTVNNTYFNYDGTVASLQNYGVTGGTAYDYWDTVEDNYGLSTHQVTAWSPNTYCGSSTWTDVTTINGGASFTTCAASASNCQYKDNITNLIVTNTISTSLSWSAAVIACNSSTFGGYAAGSWRLPTQKEFMALYEHGIASVAGANYITITNMQNYFWTSTTNSTSTGYAWLVSPALGDSGSVSVGGSKAMSYYALCIR